MNGLVFIMLLTVSSIVTGLVTQVWKKLATKFPTNIAALIIGLVIGGGTGFLYMFMNNIAFDTNNIIYLVLLGFASGFGSTIGFDKVADAVKQINYALGKEDVKDDVSKTDYSEEV